MAFYNRLAFNLVHSSLTTTDVSLWSPFEKQDHGIFNLPVFDTRIVVAGHCVIVSGSWNHIYYFDFQKTSPKQNVELPSKRSFLTKH